MADVRNNYNNYYLLFTTMGFVWLSAGCLGTYNYPHLAMLTLLVGATLFQPIYRVVRRIFGVKQTRTDHPLRMLTTLLVIGMPLGVTAGFFPFKENMNLFFPAFSLLFAMIFGIIGYIYKIKSFVILGLTNMVGNIYITHFYFNHFAMAGLFTGVLLLATASAGKLYGEIDLRLLSIKKKIKIPQGN
jgi:hypothetical protein